MKTGNNANKTIQLKLVVSYIFAWDLTIKMCIKKGLLKVWTRGDNSTAFSWQLKGILLLTARSYMWVRVWWKQYTAMSVQMMILILLRRIECSASSCKFSCLFSKEN